ncbi:MAG TPA: 50S ribosomal protein L14e [Candidatus Nanopelagicaceae bacterium]|jgi:large subunit ribosomal protein L14e|nr:50S ribosomal protein L14e [Candidatus Nanopelagicaceae bacterium]
MSVYDIGRVCVKTTGREAGKYCVVVDIVDKNYILIDGLNVRRRRANYKHLEPISETIDIKKGASHTNVEEAIKKAKLEKKLKETVSIPKK